MQPTITNVVVLTFSTRSTPQRALVSHDGVRPGHMSGALQSRYRYNRSVPIVEQTLEVQRKAEHGYRGFMHE